MPADIRKDYLIKLIGNVFEILDPSLLESYKISPSLNNFLDSGNYCVLYAFKESSEKLSLENKLPQSLKQKSNECQRDDQVLVIYKVRPTVIDSSNLHTNINIATISYSPVHTLYYTLQKVFSPVLLQSEKWSGLLEPKIQNLVEELENGLGSVLYRKDSDFVNNNPRDSLISILYPSDELLFWNDVHKGSKKSDDSERAQLFLDILAPLQEAFGTLNNAAECDISQVVETCHNVLYNLWTAETRRPYPQDRMTHLMDILGNAVSLHLLSSLERFDVWGESYLVIEEHLSNSIDVCNQWMVSCLDLTSKYWPTYGPHPWQGDPYAPSFTQMVFQRLTEILNLRKFHKKLKSLITEEEQKTFNIEDIFSVFNGISALHCNLYTQPVWKSAVEAFYRKIKPIEDLLARKLKSHLQNVPKNVFQNMEKFRRFEQLIKRDGVRLQLASERKVLLTQMTEYLYKTRQSFAESGNPDVELSANMSSAVAQILYVKQLMTKVEKLCLLH